VYSIFKWMWTVNSALRKISSRRRQTRCCDVSYSFILNRCMLHILCCWTLSIALSLSKNTVLFIFQICWNAAKVLQTEPNNTYRKYEIRPHVSARPSDQSTQVGHLSHLDPRYHNNKKKTTTPLSVDWVGKFIFLCWYHKEYLFSPVMTSILPVLWCKTAYV
jgi:hypothetical protein